MRRRLSKRQVTNLCWGIFRLKPLFFIFIFLTVSSAFAALDTKLLNQLGLERIQEQLPEFEFQNDKGEVLTATNFNSKTLILHFWATWCESCKKELPMLSRLEESIPGAELIPLSTDSSKDAEKVKTYLTSSHIGIPAYVLTAKTYNKRFVAWGVPMTYFVSPRRNLFLRAKGAKDWSKISAEDLHRLSQILSAN